MRQKASKPSLVDFIQGITTSPEKTTSYLASTIRTGNEATIDELLRLGGDPLMVQPNGKIKLHATVQYGLTSVTDRLVQSKGENRSLPSDLLPEATAREHPNIEMVKLLVALGVDKNALHLVGPKPAYGASIKTPVHIDADGKHWWHHVALDWWLENGGSPEQTTADCKTVLQICDPRSPKELGEARVLEERGGSGALEAWCQSESGRL